MNHINYEILGIIFSLTMLPAFICMGIGVYVLSANPKCAKNRIFFLYNMLIGLFGFLDFQFRSSVTLEEAFLWNRLQCIWPFIVATPLHFSILISRRMESNIYKLLIPMLYISAAMVSVCVYLPDFFVMEPALGALGWYNRYANTLYSLPIYIWATFFAILAVLLPFLASKSEKRFLQKKQLHYIFWAYLFGFSIGIGTGLFLPALGWNIIEMDKVGMALSNIIIAYSIVKVGLFEYNAKTIAESVLKTMPAAVFVTDIKGNVQLVNSAALNFLKKSEHEVIGSDISKYFTGQIFSTNENENHDDKLIVPNEKPRPVYKTCTVIYDENEVFKGMLVIASDISDLKKIEQQLVIARDQAEESDRLKSVFLANISHEIRTPMNAILGFAQLIDQSAEISEKQKKFLNLINKNVGNLLHIIDDLMEISKLESSKTKVQRSIFSIKDLFLEAEATFENIRIANNKSHLGFETRFIGSEIENIVSDRAIIMRIVGKLIENSVKFSEEGNIELGFQSIEETLAIFYVKDYGIGIPSEKCSVIFEPFRQSEDSFTRKYGGTGVSLTIAKRYVELLGGKIWVESEVSKGTIFYFSIPIWSK